MKACEGTERGGWPVSWLSQRNCKERTLSLSLLHYFSSSALFLPPNLFLSPFSALQWIHSYMKGNQHPRSYEQPSAIHSNAPVAQCHDLCLYTSLLSTHNLSVFFSISFCSISPPHHSQLNCNNFLLCHMVTGLLSIKRWCTCWLFLYVGTYC